MKETGLTSFHLKIFAIIFMFIDHMGAILFPHILFFRLLGRIAFPIFAYLIAEGASYSHNRFNYFMRLLIFAFISEGFFDIAFHDGRINFLTDTNVFFTMSFALAAITLYESLNKLDTKTNIIYSALTFILILLIEVLGNYGFIDRNLASLILLISLILMVISLKNAKPSNYDNKLLALLPSLLALYLAHIMHTDYALKGVLVILIIYLAKGRSQKFLALFMGIFIIYGINLVYDLLTLKSFYLPYDIGYFSFALMSMILIYNYNGKLGKKMKWFFYSFYPLHIILLYLIKVIIEKA